MWKILSMSQLVVIHFLIEFLLVMELLTVGLPIGKSDHHCIESHRWCRKIRIMVAAAQENWVIKNSQIPKGLWNEIIYWRNQRQKPWDQTHISLHQLVEFIKENLKGNFQRDEEVIDIDFSNLSQRDDDWIPLIDEKWTFEQLAGLDVSKSDYPCGSSLSNDKLFSNFSTCHVLLETASLYRSVRLPFHALQLCDQFIFCLFQRKSWKLLSCVTSSSVCSIWSRRIKLSTTHVIIKLHMTL